MRRSNPGLPTPLRVFLVISGKMRWQLPPGCPEGSAAAPAFLWLHRRCEGPGCRRRAWDLMLPASPSGYGEPQLLGNTSSSPVLSSFFLSLFLPAPATLGPGTKPQGQPLNTTSAPNRLFRETLDLSTRTRNPKASCRPLLPCPNELGGPSRVSLGFPVQSLCTRRPRPRSCLSLGSGLGDLLLPCPAPFPGAGGSGK